VINNIKLHWEYESGGPKTTEVPASLKKTLVERQKTLKHLIQSREKDTSLSSEENEWLTRTYSVLSILAPVMSTDEEKIEFPGDPMCLYSALSYSIGQVVQTRKGGLSECAPYNDLCPQWGYLPSPEYRAEVDGNGIRKRYDGFLLNTDETVFDPRVWNESVKEYFVNNVLGKMRPKVVLISAVSPAHRYAIDIARTVRQHSPDCIIVLGGRHTDETLRYDKISRQVTVAPTNAISKVADGSIERVFDFLVAGEGYYALDILMKSISLAMDINLKTVVVNTIIETISQASGLFGQMPGQALVVAFGPDSLHAWPISGVKTDLSEIPAPYSSFAIRARFPIFTSDERVLRTAHFMVTNSCPYHCYFCSEGTTVVGNFLTFKSTDIDKAIHRVIEYIDYGAEALFFDDSIFWAGNVGHIVNFCRDWIKIREVAEQAVTPTINIFGHEIETRKIIDLVWGAQFTVDFLASRRVPHEAGFVLRAMQAAGCTYIYMGIESMAEAVIKKVHKNINHSQPWDERVRTALGIARQAGIRVGSSILFGLDGETEETIEETISKVEELLIEGLLFVASPNILTYHPNTAATHLHRMEDKLDYHSINIDNRPPYSYFEEAFPAVVSRNLTEDRIWYLHEQTKLHWGKKRNLNPMPVLTLRSQ
jgi:radical SAM superfamily enzyme YgiQ (UPF0313 family)